MTPTASVSTFRPAGISATVHPPRESARIPERCIAEVARGSPLTVIAYKSHLVLSLPCRPPHRPASSPIFTVGRGSVDLLSVTLWPTRPDITCFHLSLRTSDGLLDDET